ncbi:Protein SEY1 3 [Tritrichomonas foetus]|uniref:Protein SEY1 homolog n=1 Tax=Tritrichomonas foetus TaxID=1144522 RepID=A0A1J4JSN9_9EUKA|nr:Protein SEY1 3 [Tritrichomonas foetus]|eukprot:OHT01778.1 Protein SEY1 3 [Tritrichomonas foetus]
MAQIIDEDANIADGLQEYLQSIGITNSGLDYHIISIIGAQSSGKSTLLNHLFHTSFATMNEATGRQQTTKGIHAAYSKENKILVFDIEGSDSRERGDADSLFERKAALFALALSEVVMVNMWQNDIGRYNASSIPLLKTVFEVNLQLFSSESKCHLLFVIRDSTADQKIIEGQVKRDLEMIWSQLTLPSNLSGRPFEDFFIFHFFALPHLRLKRDEFDVAVGQLTNEFVDNQNDTYLFKEPTGKIIPGDGLYKYICGVWDAISQNKELNLPSQRRTLSNFRCEEFVKKALTQFQEETNTQIAEKLQGSLTITDFSQICNTLIDNAVSFYNENSQQYVQDIVDDKRNDLLAKMGEILFQYYQQNCKNYLVTNEQVFNSFLENDLSSDLRECEGWEQKALEQLNHCVKNLNDHVTNDVVRNYEWEFESGSFDEKLKQRMESKLEEMIKQLEDTIFSDCSNDYKESIDKDLESAPPNMWEILRNKMNESIKKTNSQINEIIQKNTVTERKCSSRISERYHKATISRVLVASRYVQQKMNLKFDEIFRQDKEGKTRSWNPDDDVCTIFEEARQAGIGVLRMFTACQLRQPGEKIPANDILTQQMINPITAQGLEDKFNDQIEKAYIDAVRIKESKRIRINIPTWMWVLFVVFGYPKIKYLIYHPVFIIILIILMGILYFAYRKGYLSIAYNYLREYATKGVKTGVKFIKGKAGKKKNRRANTSLSKQRTSQITRSATTPHPPGRTNSAHNLSAVKFQTGNEGSTKPRIQAPPIPKPNLEQSLQSTQNPLPKRKKSLNKNMTLRPTAQKKTSGMAPSTFTFDDE